MSMELTSERVCYAQCNFCNTILAEVKAMKSLLQVKNLKSRQIPFGKVSVPYGSMLTFVTVRCGHCANLLSANMAALLQSVHLQDFQLHKPQFTMADATHKEGGSSSKCHRYGPLHSDYEQQPKTPPMRPPEKRQRVPSAYNRFIKEEIQRIKASHPEISHREAFSTAAKNWAHLPRIHFGLQLDANKEGKMEHAVAAEAIHNKPLGF